MDFPRIFRWTSITLWIVVVMSQSGCNQYGPISQQASEYAQAVYAVCNRQDTTRLEAVEQRVREAANEGELTAQEASYLFEILELARNEKWEQANANSRRLLEDQQQ